MSAALLLGMLAVLSGCSEQEPQTPYQVFNGTVKALDMETGELFIRPERAPRPWRSDRNVPCLATKDSEIYINDRFSTIEEIQVGDTVESLGYRERDRFVLSLVNITRSQPMPEEPELAPPESQPAAKPPEE